MLKDHVLYHLMTGQCLHKSLQLRPYTHFFSKIASIFKKVLHLNRHLECTNWASEASPTLGCSIKISRDISESTVVLSM